MMCGPIVVLFLFLRLRNTTLLWKTSRFKEVSWLIEYRPG